MQLLQIHAIIALSECNYCTVFSWLVSGISDGHSAISNSRAFWELTVFYLNPESPKLVSRLWLLEHLLEISREVCDKIRRRPP